MNMGWSADDKEARPPTVSMARRMMSALGLSSKTTTEDVDRPRGSSLGIKKKSVFLKTASPTALIKPKMTRTILYTHHVFTFVQAASWV